MKEKNELSNVTDFFEIISNAMEGQKTLRLEFSMVPNGYCIFINEIYLSKLDKNNLEPLLKKICDLAVSHGLKPELKISF